MTHSEGPRQTKQMPSLASVGTAAWKGRVCGSRFGRVSEMNTGLEAEGPDGVLTPGLTGHVGSGKLFGHGH